MKLCRTCLQRKPAGDYTADYGKLDGLRQSCKRCVADATSFRKWMCKDAALKTVYLQALTRDREIQGELALLPPCERSRREQRIALLAERVERGAA